MLNINHTLYFYLQAGPCVYLVIYQTHLILFSKKPLKGIVQPYDIPNLCEQKKYKKYFKKYFSRFCKYNES